MNCKLHLKIVNVIVDVAITLHIIQIFFYRPAAYNVGMLFLMTAWAIYNGYYLIRRNI